MNWGILSPTHTHILMIIFPNVIFTRLPMAQLFWELQFIGYWVRNKVWCVMFGRLHSYFENFASSFILMWWRHFLVKLPLAWAVKAFPLGSSLKSLSLYSHYTLQDDQRGRSFRRRFGCTRIFCNRVFRQIIFRVKV